MSNGQPPAPPGGGHTPPPPGQPPQQPPGGVQPPAPPGGAQSPPPPPGQPPPPPGGVQPPSKFFICPNCNNRVRVGSTECPRCGTRFADYVQHQAVYAQQAPENKQTVLGVLALIFAIVGAVMVIASLETLIIGLLLAITGLILGIVYLAKSPSKAIGITAVVIAVLALPLAPISCTVHFVEEVGKEIKKTENTGETTTQESTEAQPVVAEGVVGQPVKCGDLSITVHSFTGSAGEPMFEPEAGNQYIVVDLEVDNNAQEAEHVSTVMQMSIKTPEGYGYDQAMYFPEPKYPDGAIAAGQKARGNVAFEVPATIGAMNFVFDPMFGAPVSIKLQ